MKQQYKYSFAKRMKIVCPQCGKKTFVPYVDNATGQVLNSGVGKCDRANHCAFHYTPSEFFRDHGIHPHADHANHADNNFTHIRQNYKSTKIITENKNLISAQPQNHPVDNNLTQNPQNFLLRDPCDLRGGKQSPSTLPFELVTRSVCGSDYSNNVLIQWILERCTAAWGAEEASRRVFRAVGHLAVGNTKDGDCVFWQIAPPNEVRTGKIMRYKADGHRDHAHFGTWVHARLKKKDFQLQQCLFGLHQIHPGGEAPVAIVESEKTALIASILCPENFLWMATGGCHNLKESLLKPLKGREIRLFPDLGQYENWSTIARQLNSKFGGRITVDTTLERVATPTDRDAGLDLGDYLVQGIGN